MKPIVAAFATLLTFSAGTAFAACPTGVDKGQTAGIAKDGTHAPLATAETEAKANPVQKDGKTMPLATQEGGGNKNLAMSQQDIEAQQKGDKTAAAKADDDACKN